MNIDDLLSGTEVSSIYTERQQNYSLSILSTPISEFYTNPDFVSDLKFYISILDKCNNKTYVVYDLDYSYIGCTDHPVPSKIVLKRAPVSVFLLKIYGFNGVEIMDILKISKTYYIHLLKKVRDIVKPLKIYLTPEFAVPHNIICKY